MHVRVVVLTLLLLVSAMGNLQTERQGEETGSVSSEASGRSNHTSNLSWGPSSGLNVFVVPGGFIVLSINITNSANVSDPVDFTILGQSGWNCYWNATSIPCHQPNSIEMAPGYLAWPKFDIHVPEVVNGTPSAFVRHPFTLTATSSLDGAKVDYWFTLEVDAWHAVSIDSGAANLTLDPGLKQRTPITARNLGNAPASIVARVVPLGVDGEPLPGIDPAISFLHDGWLVGIFNIHLLNGPGAQGMLADTAVTVDLEVQPPSQASGVIRIGVVVWSAMNPYEPVMVEVNATIVWERAGAFVVDDDCRDDLLPNGFCNSAISVTNNGNFEDTFEIVVESTEWLRADLSRSLIVVQKGETVEAATLMLRVDGMVPAFSHGQAEISLQLSDGTVLATHEMDVRVGPLVDWDLKAVESSTDSRDNVSVAFTLRNLGNGEDGLQITLHVDMSVEHGLVPPDGASHGAVDGIPRYFEIGNVPPGVNFTFRAWMHIPRDMEANGTVTMTVEMQSTLKPEIVFINETAEPFLAEAFRPENILEPTAWENFERQMASIWNQFNGLCLTMLVAIMGGLALYQATLYRKRRDEEWKAKLKSQEPPEREEPEDWLSKFKEGAVAVPGVVVGAVIEAPRVAAKVFTDLFASKTTKRRKERPPPNPDLLDAANTVLTHHEKDKELERLNDLAAGLDDDSDKHPANILLPDAKEPDTGRTVRKPKRKVKGRKAPAKATDDEAEDDLPDFISPKSKRAATKKAESKDSQAVTPPAELDGDEEFDLDL